MEKLVEIRCTNMVVKKKGSDKPKICNRLCVKVAPGSKGEAHCVTCDNKFEFDVIKDNHSFYDIFKAAKPVTRE